MSKPREVRMFLWWGIGNVDRRPKAKVETDDGNEPAVYCGEPLDAAGDATAWIVCISRALAMLHGLEFDLADAVAHGRKFYESRGFTFSPERAARLMNEPAQLIPVGNAKAKA